MLNEALRLIRVFHDMSQSELSNELGISNSYLSEVESGKKQPTLDLLGKYSEVFDMPVSSLLLFSEQLDPSKRTDALRISMAKKVVSILDWVAQKSGRVTGTNAKEKAA